MTITKKLINDGELKKEFEIILPVELVSSSIDNEAIKIQKNYKIAGFRPGKVPLNMIKNREKEVLFANTVEILVENTINDLVKENKYDLALQPKVDLKTMEDGKDVNFVVTIELMPVIPKINLKDIKLDSYNINIEEKDIDNAVNNLLKVHKKWVLKDGTAELSDSVKIDFVGKIDGQEFEGGKSENYQLELGSHSFIDNFEEQLVGKKANDKIIVNVTFPDNYHKSSLAGKPATFDVVIKEVLKSEKPELNDDFVNTYFGVATVENFKEAVKAELENSYKNLSKEDLNTKIIEYLEKINNFSVPEGIVNNRFNSLKSEEEKLNLKKGKSDPIDEEKIKKEAEKIARIGMIFGDFAKKQNIEVLDNEITEEIMKSAVSMPGYEKMVIDFYRKNKNALDGLRNQIMERKILDFIGDNITKNIVSVNIEEYEKIKGIKSNN